MSTRARVRRGVCRQVTGIDSRPPALNPAPSLPHPKGPSCTPRPANCRCVSSTGSGDRSVNPNPDPDPGPDPGPDPDPDPDPDPGPDPDPDPGRVSMAPDRTDDPSLQLDPRILVREVLFYALAIGALLFAESHTEDPGDSPPSTPPSPPPLKPTSLTVALPPTPSPDL